MDLCRRKSFLLPNFLRRITDDLHLITSQDELHSRLSDWIYWTDFDAALWLEVKALREEMDAALARRRAPLT